MEKTREPGRRSALILGGSKGLGFGVASALVTRGVDVAIVGRDTSALDAAAARLGNRQGTVQTFPCDLSDRSSVSDLLARVDGQIGPVDILLLNGAGPPPFPAAAFDADTWSVQFEAMFLHQVMIATHLLPAMRKRRFGRIVAVSSTSVREPIPGLVASNALRSALAAWAKTLSLEVAGDGVTVNIVMPGRFATERTAYFDRTIAGERGIDPAIVASESQAEIPLGRYGTPEEFGEAVAFLAGEGARYITGVALPVDGGLSRSLV